MGDYNSASDNYFNPTVRRIEVLEQAIKDEIHQLEQWIKESQRGGWSTHQVDPMRKRADELRRILI